MHMLHMHISIDIIITLSFFITDFLLSSVLNGVSALDGGIVTLSAGFVNPLFYIPAICKKIRQQSPTVFVCFAARIILSYPPKHSLTCCAFTQRGMKKSHQAALDGSQSGTKASQNSPPAMAANNLDHFLPRRCVKKICRWHIFSIRSRRLCRRSIHLGAAPHGESGPPEAVLVPWRKLLLSPLAKLPVAFFRDLLHTKE